MTLNDIGAGEVVDGDEVGAAEGQSDRVVVDADNDDTISSGDATEVTAKGLAPTIRIVHPEAAADDQLE